MTYESRTITIGTYALCMTLTEWTERTGEMNETALMIESPKDESVYRYRYRYLACKDESSPTTISRLEMKRHALLFFRDPFSGTLKNLCIEGN